MSCDVVVGRERERERKKKRSVQKYRVGIGFYMDLIIFLIPFMRM